MSFDPAKTTVKCVEVSKCFLNKRVGISSYDLKETILVGDMARFMANAKQLEIIKPKQVAAIGEALKIDYNNIESNFLPLMEEFGWINVEWDGRKAVKIYENIPPIEDVLPTLGNHWANSEPTNVEISTVESLSLLTNRPYTKEALQSEIGTPDEDFSTAMNYGFMTNCFGSFNSLETDEEFIWTPYYWTRNSEKALKFLKRQSYEEFSTIEELSNYLSSIQGVPKEKISQPLNIIDAGIVSGFFPSIKIQNPSGEKNHEYVFKATPQFDLDPKKDIFEKARLIVSTLRHGQYHASVSRIKSPLHVLYALKEGRLGPHSHGMTQYSILAANRICKIDYVSDHGGSYKVTLIKTPENDIAIKMAESMLSGNEPTEGLFDYHEIDLINGSFNYSAEQRQNRNIKTISDSKIFSELLECIQGRGLGS